MPKDYAKKKTSKKTRRGASRSKKQSAPLGLWLLTMAAVFTLTGGLIYLKWFQPAQPTIKQANQQSKPATTKPAPTNKAEDEVPFYDVHKDLTNKQVEIPKEDLKLPEIYKKFYYNMPCGSFRDNARAEELKANIALSGSNSNITSVKYQGETWFRVQLGPFNSKRQAERIRHRLQDNGIHDCRIIRHIKSDS